MLSNTSKNTIPNIKPTAAGTQAAFPCSSAISMDGINNDQTEAAIITPDANPNRIFSTFLFSLFFIRNTIAEPSVVPKNGINNPVNTFIYFLPLIHFLLSLLPYLSSLLFLQVT